MSLILRCLSIGLLSLMLPVIIVPRTAQAGKLRDRLIERRVGGKTVEGTEPSVASNVFMTGDTAQYNIAYGPHEKNKIDVYSPPAVSNAPMILMVHGGGWRHGDKAYGNVVQNKGKHYLAKGYVFASIGYRLMPDADPLGQARDIDNAIAYIQQNASNWGGDASRIVVMGHSAGAHLVSLLAANPQNATFGKAKRWRGTVVLDSAAMNVEKMMMEAKWLPKFYHEAFGADRGYWQATSPYNQLMAQASPILLVCSLQRGEQSCGQMQSFADRAKELGVPVGVLREDLSHGEINTTLGQDGDYTRAVDDFIQKVVN